MSDKGKGWKERYDERVRKKHEYFDKELRECSEKGVEISQECKMYFKKRFEWGRRNPQEKKKTMTRIDLKMMDSKKLRELRTMIRKELDFRADIGQELEDGGIKEWVSATEWSARIQKQKEKEIVRRMNKITITTPDTINKDDSRT